MNEEQINRLRNRLGRKKERLEATNGDFFLPKLRRFWRFLNSEPLLSPILAELQDGEKGKEAASVASGIGPGSKYDPTVRMFVDLLKRDEDIAAMAYHLLKGVCEDGWNFDLISRQVWGSHPGNMTEYNMFKPEVVAPLCDYLDEKLDEQQAILGLLVRYKKRCEWFNKRELLRTAQDEQARKGDSKKRAEVEKVLKEDLYRYLHDQGMEFTIEPPSDRGEIDLILDQAGAGRTFVEGKVFDNVNRNAKYIVKGFGQLLHYLGQYNAGKGYLLVYQTCEEQLVVDGAELLGTVPFVRCEGKTIFVLVVDICDHERPVSQRTYRPVVVAADELRQAAPGE